MNVPDNDKQNQEQFLELLRVADPALHAIKLAMIQTNSDPNVVFHIIRGLGNINLGTGYGKIIVTVHGHFVQGIVTEERVRYDLKTEVDA